MKHMAVLLLLICSCTETQQKESVTPVVDFEPWLIDEAATRGVNFSWISGDTGTFNMPEIIGGGAAMLDFDNDGDLDLYFIQGGHLGSSETESNVLLRNDEGIFVDITEQSNTGDTGYGMGIAVGDYNNDAFEDIYILKELSSNSFRKKL